MTPAVLVAALLVPAVPAAAVQHDDPPSPSTTAVRAELAGHVSVGAQMRAARADALQIRSVRANVRLARRAARLQGDRLPAAHRDRVEDLSRRALEARNERLRDRIERLRKRRAARTAAAVPAGQAATATPGHLAAIAACESGGNPSAVGGGGTYRGKYQFDLQTWAGVGGSGDPAAASEAEQDARAAILYARTGGSAWPSCS